MAPWLQSSTVGPNIVGRQQAVMIFEPGQVSWSRKTGPVSIKPDPKKGANKVTGVHSMIPRNYTAMVVRLILEQIVNERTLSKSFFRSNKMNFCPD